MTLTIPNITNPFYYPWAFINYFFFLWALAKLTHFTLRQNDILPWAKTKYSTLDNDKQQNVVTYVIEIILTSIMLPLSMIGCADILFRGKDTLTSEQSYNMTLLAAQLLPLLYLWELVYRKTFGWPLLIHHIMTMFFAQAMSYTLYHEQSYVILRLMIVLATASTTEQLSFVALFFYRLDIASRKVQAKLFYGSSIMSFVIKTVIFIGAMYDFIVNYHRDFRHPSSHNNNYDDDDDGSSRTTGADGDGAAATVTAATAAGASTLHTFWNIVFIPALLILFASQVFACKVLWDLGSRCMKKAEVESDQKQQQQAVQNDGVVKDSPTTATTSRRSIRRSRMDVNLSSIVVERRHSSILFKHSELDDGEDYVYDLDQDDEEVMDYDIEAINEVTEKSIGCEDDDNSPCVTTEEDTR